MRTFWVEFWYQHGVGGIIILIDEKCPFESVSCCNRDLKSGDRHVNIHMPNSYPLGVVFEGSLVPVLIPSNLALRLDSHDS